MKYHEMQKLIGWSKHKTIGCVKMYLKRGEDGKPKADYIFVTYISGRVAHYTKREEIPESVMNFLRHQNKIIRGYAYNGQPLVYYFWLDERMTKSGESCEDGVQVVE